MHHTSTPVIDTARVCFHSHAKKKKSRPRLLFKLQQTNKARWSTPGGQTGWFAARTGQRARPRRRSATKAGRPPRLLFSVNGICFNSRYTKIHERRIESSTEHCGTPRRRQYSNQVESSQRRRKGASWALPPKNVQGQSLADLSGKWEVV